MAIGMITGIKSNDNDLKLTVNKNFVWLDKNNSDTVTVTTPSDGKIYVLSSANNVISATINANVITLKALKYGTAIITVSQDTGTGDYINKMPTSKNIFVTNIDPMLENNSWEAISDVSQSGTGSNYWSVGDMKSITLNGTIGILSLSNFVTNVFILHFNYPSNGKANNNITWHGFKTNDRINIALVDSKYNDYALDGTIYFNMNHWGDNTYGGWKGCDLRYDILGATSTAPSDYGLDPSSTRIGYDATQNTISSPVPNTLMAALSSDFRNSLKLWSRWIDIIGQNSNEEQNIQETIDAISLLAEFEVFGTRTYANQYEQNHQIQIDYYKLGNYKYKYYHNNPDEVVDRWWLASPHIGTISIDNRFCSVLGGRISNAASRASFAIAPVFKT